MADLKEALSQLHSFSTQAFIDSYDYDDEYMHMWDYWNDVAEALLKGEPVPEFKPYEDEDDD